MSLDFSRGRQIESSHVNQRITSELVRDGIVDCSSYISGEAILLPSVRVLAETIGMSKGVAFNYGRSYAEFIQNVTGLSVVRHTGLILIEDPGQITELATHFENDTA